MSATTKLVFEIQEMYELGHAEYEIVKELGVPLELVEDVVRQMQEYDNYDDSMDGDAESALASAGFGTDEDYGYYGDDY